MILNFSPNPNAHYNSQRQLIRELTEIGYQITDIALIAVTISRSTNLKTTDPLLIFSAPCAMNNLN